MFKIEAEKTNITQNNLYTFNETTQAMEFNYKNDIEAAYKELFNNIYPGINTESSTAIGQIITSLTQADLANIANFENLLNSFFFGGSGYNLDLWAWNIFRVTRKQGVKSSVVVTITGIPGTYVSDDFEITDGEMIYKIAAPVTILPNGEISAIFYATELSEYIAKKDSINTIRTSVVGVEKVNNSLAATPAIMQETDEQLFNRCVTFGSTAKNASFRSILANVAEVQGVEKIAGAENFTDETQTISGVDLSPHSFLIVVLGGDNTEIAEAILNSRATGCNILGDIETTLVVNRERFKIRFSRPTLVELKASIKVKAKNLLMPTDFAEKTQKALVNVINSLDINTTITQPLLVGKLMEQIKEFNLIEFQFGLLSGDFGYDSITLKLNEMATIGAENISVVDIDAPLDENAENQAENQTQAETI